MRSILAPPDVEPAHAPVNIRMNINDMMKGPQLSKLVTDRPVLVMVDMI